MALTKQGIRIGGAYVEITADTTKLDSALNQAESTTKAISDTILHAGVALSGIGGSVLTPVMKAAHVYADFERVMLMTQSVTKATQLQFSTLTEKAKELGATTSWTATQVAEGMLSLGRMGFDANDIDKMISGVMDLGRALDIEVGDAAKMLGSAMNQFGASTDKAAHYADALAAATNGAAISSDELLDTLKYVGSAANGLGADVETVLALVMALRNSGIAASQAGTQLRSMFLKLQNPKTIEVFGEKFGVEIYDAQGRLRSLLDIFVDAQEKARLFGDQLPQIMTKIFGRLVSPGALTLLQTDELKDFRDMLYECDGASAKLRANMESGVFGSLKRVESAVEAVGIQMTQTLIPAITTITERTIGFAGYMKEMMIAHPDFANALTEQASCAVAVGAALVGGSAAIKGYTALAGVLTGSLKALTAAWAQLSVNQKATNVNFQNGITTVVHYSKAMTALRLAAVATKKALAGLVVGVGVAALWEGMVLAFRTVSEYAHKTAEEMKRAREENEAMRKRDETNADELTKRREEGMEKIQKFFSLASSDKPLNPVEKRNLDALYDELKGMKWTDENGNERSIFETDVDNHRHIDKSDKTASGYSILHEGSENFVISHFLSGLQQEYEPQINASKIKMADIDPDAFKPTVEKTAEEAKPILDDFYKPLADVFSRMSNSQISTLTKDTYWNNSDSFIDKVQEAQAGYRASAPYTGSQQAAAARTLEIDKAATSAIEQIKKMGDLSEEDEAVLRKFLVSAGNRELGNINKDGTFYNRILKDYGADFIETVNSALGGSKLKKEVEDTKSLEKAYNETGKAADFDKPYENEENRQRREVQEQQAAENRKSIFEKETEAQNADEAEVRRRNQTQSENALDKFDKDWADYLDKLREAVLATLAPAQLEEFHKSGKDWRTLLTEDENKTLAQQEQRHEERRTALEIQAKNERLEKTQGVAVDDIKAASEAFAKSLTGGDIEKAAEAGRNLDGLIAAATQNGYDITEARKAIVEDIQNAVGQMSQVKLDSQATMNAWESMEMSNAYQIDVQRGQLEQLQQLSASARAILTQLQQDPEYKEFF